MVRIADGLVMALGAMQHEADRMEHYADNIARSAFATPGCNAEIHKLAGDAGMGRGRKHMGRLAGKKDPGLQKTVDRSHNGCHGIELATDLVHLVNVQHNFDANAKAASTIDTMMDSILNLRA